MIGDLDCPSARTLIFLTYGTTATENPTPSFLDDTLCDLRSTKQEHPNTAISIAKLFGALAIFAMAPFSVLRKTFA
ncbi:hypothetical protein ABIE78_003141 [Sinorhizobium fredii]|uniref:Uncharacterized protein n=1 Tax=Sinorhizobium fredii (strain USDA 257) TaxID=1185652 RepID=I3X597_SINF2|nr:hypothetical protein [Sinorhizobium fredii]AFL51053.1 hypothetical protein USDA257_c24770 [Sinorhizobium fredii USDA 257]